MCDLLRRYYNTKTSQCRLYCLEDRIRFERMKTIGGYPFRDSLPYKDIKYWSLSTTYLDVFSLYVEDGKCKKNTFEIYRCNSPQEAEKICSVIDKARREPNCRFTVPKRSSSFFSLCARSVDRDSASCSNSLFGSPRTRPEGKERHESLEDYLKHEKSTQSESIPVPTGNQNLQSTNSVHLQRDQTLRGQAEEQLVIYNGQSPLPCEKEQMDRGTDLKLTGPENVHDFSDKEWFNNTTFVQFDPIRGVRVNDRGPVYLFAMRMT
ncbi:unnamed protein product [Calicophoron daubneyi]|uniref:Trematode PH-like domain-containing protein n=1 Tax=Calicophoron daubneyi TaxID=300641 RepID=A0AAV2TIJ0_CALDB